MGAASTRHRLWLRWLRLRSTPHTAPCRDCTVPTNPRTEPATSRDTRAPAKPKGTRYYMCLLPTTTRCCESVHWWSHTGPREQQRPKRCWFTNSHSIPPTSETLPNVAPPEALQPSGAPHLCASSGPVSKSNGLRMRCLRREPILSWHDATITLSVRVLLAHSACTCTQSTLAIAGDAHDPHQIDGI